MKSPIPKNDRRDCSLAKDHALPTTKNSETTRGNNPERVYSSLMHSFPLLALWVRTCILRTLCSVEPSIFPLKLKYERAFADAYAALNVLPPTYEPRATGHITQMIELMQLLIDRGMAYAPGNGDVYLEVRKLESYLTLSRQKLDDLQSAADADETFKRDVRDFALWKGAKPGDPSWPTLWVLGGVWSQG